MRGLKGLPQLGANPGGASAPFQHLVHGILPDGDVRLGEQGGLRRLHVAVAVDLRAGGPYGGPLAGVQRAELDTRPVGPQAHHAAEGVDFPDHMPFGEPPDGGVARKVPDAIHIARDQQHALPEPRQRHGGFAARMSRAYDYTIEHKLFLGKKRGRETLQEKGSPSPVPQPFPRLSTGGEGTRKEYSLKKKQGESRLYRNVPFQQAAGRRPSRNSLPSRPPLHRPIQKPLGGKGVGFGEGEAPLQKGSPSPIFIIP